MKAATAGAVSALAELVPCKEGAHRLRLRGASTRWGEDPAAPAVPGPMARCRRGWRSPRRIMSGCHSPSMVSTDPAAARSRGANRVGPARLKRGAGGAGDVSAGPARSRRATGVAPCRLRDQRLPPTTGGEAAGQVVEIAGEAQADDLAALNAAVISAMRPRGSPPPSRAPITPSAVSPIRQVPPTSTEVTITPAKGQPQRSMRRRPAPRRRPRWRCRRIPARSRPGP